MLENVPELVAPEASCDAASRAMMTVLELAKGILACAQQRASQVHHKTLCSYLRQPQAER